jgi:hypothetical protein
LKFYAIYPRFLRVEGGELFDKISEIGKYTEQEAKLLFYQMVLAIKVILV